VQLPGHGDVRFDLAVPDLRWAIEVDLHPRHRETMGIASDTRRDRAAAAIGWTTSRVTETQYDHRFNETIADLAALHSRLRVRLAG
jgi:very-short-patch-repair endonuclease